MQALDVKDASHISSSHQPWTQRDYYLSSRGFRLIRPEIGGDASNNGRWWLGRVFRWMDWAFQPERALAPR